VEVGGEELAGHHVFQVEFDVGGAGAVVGQPAPLLGEAQPRTQAAVPRPVDCLVEPLARQQVIVFRPHALDAAPLGNALEQVGWQQATFGLDSGEGGAGDGLHNAIILC
jgi:hypothetical protein